jgi:hypothetical protein
MVDYFKPGVSTQLYSTPVAEELIETQVNPVSYTLAFKVTPTYAQVRLRLGSFTAGDSYAACRGGGASKNPWNKL